MSFSGPFSDRPDYSRGENPTYVTSITQQPNTPHVSYASATYDFAPNMGPSNPFSDRPDYSRGEVPSYDTLTTQRNNATRRGNFTSLSDPSSVLPDYSANAIPAYITLTWQLNNAARRRGFTSLFSLFSNRRDYSANDVPAYVTLTTYRNIAPRRTAPAPIPRVPTTSGSVLQQLYVLDPEGFSWFNDLPWMYKYVALKAKDFFPGDELEYFEAMCQANKKKDVVKTMSKAMDRAKEKNLSIARVIPQDTDFEKEAEEIMAGWSQVDLSKVDENESEEKEDDDNEEWQDAKTGEEDGETDQNEKKAEETSTEQEVEQEDEGEMLDDVDLHSEDEEEWDGMEEDLADLRREEMWYMVNRTS